MTSAADQQVHDVRPSVSKMTMTVGLVRSTGRLMGVETADETGSLSHKCIQSFVSINRLPGKTRLQNHRHVSSEMLNPTHSFTLMVNMVLGIKLSQTFNKIISLGLQ